MHKKKPSQPSKKELISFIQQEVGISVPSLETLGTGVVYCKLFENIHPGTIKNLKPTPKYNWEYLSNLKILQKAMQTHKIAKQIDINKLAECKYQDNLLMITWLKEYYEDTVRGVLQPTKQVKVDNSLPSFKNSTGFIQQTPNKAEPEVSCSMLISPMMISDFKFFSEIKTNKENRYDNLNSNIKRIDELFQIIKEDDEQE